MNWQMDNQRARNLRIYHDEGRIGPYGVVEAEGAAFLRFRGKDKVVYFPLEPNNGARTGSFSLTVDGYVEFKKLIGESVRHEQAAGR